jgi:hypothetical protein
MEFAAVNQCTRKPSREYPCLAYVGLLGQTVLDVLWVLVGGGIDRAYFGYGSAVLIGAYFGYAR